MLSYLHIKNIAIIKELEMDFHSGLNILTGETGAGKSILLGSIQFVLGKKMSKDFIRNGEKEALVECIFHVEEPNDEKKNIHNLLEKQGICIDEQGIILSRKTTSNGRSVFRINNEIVRVDIVKKLASNIIDIHSQHEHQSLLHQPRHIHLLDRFADQETKNQLEEYKKEYKEFQQLKLSLQSDMVDDEKRKREIAFLEFEISEIENADVKISEDKKVQEEYDELKHLRKVFEVLHQTKERIDGETDIGSYISSALYELHKVENSDENIRQFVHQLESVEDILSDVNRGIARYIDDCEFDEERFRSCEERINIINNMKMKYGDTVEVIHEALKEKKEIHTSLLHFEENQRQFKEKYTKLESQLQSLATKISKARKKTAKYLSEELTNSLQELELKDAGIYIQVEKEETLQMTGNDKVQFLIKTNHGEEYKPLDKIASGGELSRVMLALKSVLAEHDGVDTLIFDEIDTGISGKTANKVGMKMSELGRKRQLICITHLPQIAAMADAHYRIQKEKVDQKTETTIVALEEQDSINEIARMIGGDHITDAVLHSVAEMKERKELQ